MIRKDFFIVWNSSGLEKQSRGKKRRSANSTAWCGHVKLISRCLNRWGKSQRQAKFGGIAYRIEARNAAIFKS